MKIKPIDKLIYLKKKKDNNQISDKELVEYQSIISNNQINENDINSSVEEYGYNKKTTLNIFFATILKQGKERGNRYLLSAMLFVFLYILFHRDKLNQQ